MQMLNQCLKPGSSSSKQLPSCRRTPGSETVFEAFRASDKYKQHQSAYCSLLILLQSPFPIIFTPKFYRETASSTGAGKSINANAYSRCSMAITWTSRTQLRNMENHALFPSSHPKFQDIKRQKKMSPNMLPLQAPPDHQDSAPLR